MMTTPKIYHLSLSIFCAVVTLLWPGISHASCSWVSNSFHVAELTLDFDVAAPTNVSFRRVASASFSSQTIALASGALNNRAYIVRCNSQSDVVTIGGTSLSIGSLNGGSGYYMKPLEDVDVGMQATSTSGTWIYPSAAGGDVSFTVGQIYSILGYDYTLYGGTLSWYYLLGLGGNANIRLYSGANLSGGGTWSGGEMFTVMAGDILLGRVSASAFTVTAASCSVNDYDASVDLGSLRTRDLTGAGGAYNGTAFSITLNCSSTKLSPTLTFDAEVVDNLPTVLKNTGDATGVGVQLLSGNTVVTPGSTLSLGNPGSTSNIIHTFYARIYQTSDTVTAGSVEAVTTFTLDYE